jgi:hypothetical protein
VDLPFSRQQFFDVFEAYNDGVWPVQVALVAVAAGSVLAVWRRRGEQAIPFALALLWAWTALGYHVAFFTAINGAAWIFGAAFLLEAALIVLYGWKSRLRFDVPLRAPGLALVAYALIGYPIVGMLSGHAYPRAPTFGLPCPTTIFTLGMLLLARKPVPPVLFAIPLVWSVVATSAAIELGVAEDFGLTIAGVVTLVTLAGAARPPRSSHVPRA